MNCFGYVIYILQVAHSKTLPNFWLLAVSGQHKIKMSLYLIWSANKMAAWGINSTFLPYISDGSQQTKQSSVNSCRLSSSDWCNQQMNLAFYQHNHQWQFKYKGKDFVCLFINSLLFSLYSCLYELRSKRYSSRSWIYQHKNKQGMKLTSPSVNGD